MADRQYHDDIPMDDYYENGMLREDPDDIPAAKKKHNVPSGKSKRQAAMGKKIIIGACGIAAAALIITVAVLVSKRSNDGNRFAEKLSQCIGSQIQTAQSSSKIDLDSQTGFALIDNTLSDGASCTASKKTATVQGVSIPEWAIICNSPDGTLFDVWFYQYEMLEDTPYGIKRKAYLDPHQTAAGATTDQLEETLGIKPYCIHYLNDGTQTREYRYCFKDAETDNLTAYIITANFDRTGMLIGAPADRRVDFMSAILRSSLE